MNKQFSHLKTPLVYHKYCSNCQVSVIGEETVCRNNHCAKDLTASGGMSYFIEIPPGQQLKDFMIETLAAEYLSEDQTSSPVSAQFATILDKSWSASLSDTKLKEKLAKYDRPENCGRLLAPKVNPEIWSQISNLGQRQDLKFVAVQKALTSAGS